MEALNNTAPDLQVALFNVQSELVIKCQTFVTTSAVATRLGPDRVRVMLHALSCEGGLRLFRALLHRYTVQCASDSSFDPTQYWELRDAITLWDDSHPGRLHRVSERQRDRWLGQATRLASGAVMAFMH